MGGIYSYPNMSSRINRQSLTQTCTDCDASPILVKAFFGVSGTTQQKTLAIIATTNNSIIRNIAKIFLFISSLVIYLSRIVSKRILIVSNDTVSFVKNIAKRIGIASTINYFMSKGAIFIKALSIISNIVSLNIKKIFSNKAIINNINILIKRNISKTIVIVTQVLFNLIKRINKYCSIIVTSAQTFLNNKVFLKIITGISNISSISVRNIGSLKATVSNVSSNIKKNIGKISSLMVNTTREKSETIIFKKSSITTNLNTSRFSSIFRIFSNVVSSVSSKFIGIPKILSNSVNISILKSRQTFKNIIVTAQNNNVFNKAINKVVTFGINLYATAIIIPIIISQHFYLTLATTVNIGNITLNRLLTISKQLSNSMNIINSNIKDIIKNYLFNTSINNSKIVRIVKERLLIVSLQESFSRNIYKIFHVIINVFSLLSIPARLLTIKTYYSIRNIISTVLKKRSSNSMILIKTNLTPLTRQNKSWISRRFTKGTLK